MGKVAAHGRMPAYSANGELIGQPVNVAVAGTERAVGKLAQRALHPAGQFARLPQRKICRVRNPRLIGGRHYSLEILWRQNQKIQIWLAAYANKVKYNAADDQGVHDHERAHCRPVRVTRWLCLRGGPASLLRVLWYGSM